MTGPLTLSGDPVAALQAATKQYVDNLLSGLTYKAPCAVATTANIALTGEQTLDGVLTSASRVLVKNQTLPAQNGIYVSSAGAWARAADFDAWTEITSAAVWVDQGTTQADTGWVVTSSAGGTVGVTAINFSQWGGAGAFQAASVLLSSLAALAIVAGDLIYGSGANAFARLAKGADGQRLQLAAGVPSWVSSPEAMVSQTILNGPTDASGNPNFWPATSASLTLTMQNVTTTNIIAAIAKGLGINGYVDAVIVVSTNLAIVLPASSTSFIFLDDTGALTSSTLAPIYQRGGTIAVTNGQHTYDINARQMYLGNGTTAPAVNKVCIGEAVTAVGTVTSTRPYAYRGEYQIPDTTISQAAGALATVQHNIGTTLVNPAVAVKNITAEGNYTAGMIVAFQSQIVTSGSGTTNPATIEDRNTCTVTTANGGGYIVVNRTTGAIQGLTVANWKLTGFVKRNF